VLQTHAQQHVVKSAIWSFLFRCLDIYCRSANIQLFADSRGNIRAANRSGKRYLDIYYRSVDIEVFTSDSRGEKKNQAARRSGRPLG
jgi:hypothetical protein